jgi:hypothetical protein
LCFKEIHETYSYNRSGLILKIRVIVIKCSKSKDRQYNGQQQIIKKKTNKSRQTNSQKTKDQATRTLLKTGRGGGVTDVFGKGKSTCSISVTTGV